MDKTVVSIGGWGFDGQRRPSETYRRGRRCDEPGCRTVLSIYNPGHYCAVHESRILRHLRDWETSDARRSATSLRPGGRGVVGR